MPSKTRQSDSKFKDLGFILHQYPYTETSVILDVFTQSHGRFNLIAKGAKRPNSQLRVVLQLFQPLWLSYSGRHELKTLSKAEPEGPILSIHPQYAMNILYIHELLIQLCPRQSPQASIFDAYIKLLNAFNQFSQQEQKYMRDQLWQFQRQYHTNFQHNHNHNHNHQNQYLPQLNVSQNTFNNTIDDDIQIQLRRFELNLLKETGVGLYLKDLIWVLDCPADQNFIYLKDIGITAYQEHQHKNNTSPKVHALTLWALLTDGFESYAQHPAWRSILMQAKQLNRYILSTILPYDLKTRIVLKSIDTSANINARF